MGDIVQDMQTGFALTRIVVAEMRALGMDDTAIASVLMNTAGGLYRDALPHEPDRRAVLMHMAEVCITGQPQPIEPFRR